MQISYGYLAVLLLFAVLTGVVIGDRLAANTEGSEDGRSGGCAGLASARLHNCAHKYGTLRAAPRRAGGHRDAACDTEGVNGRDDDD